MILTSILSFLTSALTSILIFYMGKLLIYNRQFKLYLGIAAPAQEPVNTALNEDIAPDENKDSQNQHGANDSVVKSAKKVSIEEILTITGRIIQWIAILKVVTQFVLSILVISRSV